MLFGLLVSDGAVFQRLALRLFARGFPVLRFVFRLFIGVQRFLELLFRGKDGIGPAFADEFLRVDLIDVLPLGLLERSVRSAVDDVSVRVFRRTLVEFDVIAGERPDQRLRRAGDLPLGVGVFDPQEKDAAGLMGQTFVDHHLIHAAEVDESGRAGSEPRHLCAFRQRSRRIPLLNVFRRFFDMRVQQLREFFKIHCPMTSVTQAFYLFIIPSRRPKCNTRFPFFEKENPQRG